MMYRPGDIIYGDFTVVQLAGVGATSHVYTCQPRASRHDLPPLVAVKILHDKLACNEKTRARFLREARLVRNLQHPNIVRVFDIIDTPAVTAFVMELVQGPTLMEWQSRDATHTTDLELCDIFVGILLGLGYTHAQGIIHRDLKPANIILTHDDTETNESGLKPCIIDFGVARRVDAPEPEEFETIQGTAAYISPDEIRSPLEVCPASDLYSLGVMLYEMAAGTRPFQSDKAPELFEAHLSESPQPPRSLNPSLSPALERVILRTLAKRPEERYPNAEALRGAIEQALTIAWEIRTAQYARPTLPPAREELQRYVRPSWLETTQHTLRRIFTTLFNPGVTGHQYDPHYLSRPPVNLHGFV